MSENLWKKDFSPLNSQKKPKDIIQEQCDYLYEKTGQKIIGRISEYTGAIHSKEILKDFNKLISYKGTLSFDVQDELGVVTNGDDFKYEFYITSVKTPKYKYRAFFIEYGLSIYPTVFVLDNEIAEELEQEEEFSVSNEEELRECLSKIFNSKKMETVIGSLLSFNNTI